MLKGVVEQYTLRIRISFDHFRYAKGPAFAHTHRDTGKFSFELQRLVASLGSTVNRGDSPEPDRFAAIPPTEYCNINILVEPTYHVLDVRRFACSTYREITHGNDWQVKPDTPENSGAIKQIPEANNKAIYQRHREQKHPDYNIFRHEK
jgi:hypothetical protein